MLSGSWDMSLPAPLTSKLRKILQNIERLGEWSSEFIASELDMLANIENK